MSEPFRFAHLSDPHLSSLHTVAMKQLCSKRILGYLSWKIHRQAEHRREVLTALERDLQACTPDHITITGDLTHLGLPSEFQEVQEWLHGLGPASKVTVIPGNHDAYVDTPWEDTFALWAPYMCSDHTESVESQPHYPEHEFPSIRIRGSIAFIGLSSAQPTAPFMATGCLGKQQLNRLSSLLATTREHNLFRIVLVHHPPALGTVKWRKRLVDSQPLLSVLGQYGAELILHGHAHRSSFVNLESPTGSIPAIGVPSASYIGKRMDRTAQYHLYELTQSEGGWNLHCSIRGYVPEKDIFEEQNETTITLPYLVP
ncbi:MAG: metallophosphoesterase [Nitrospirales bacterium]|nr:metallophosphoesterase [Nitrospirales bacterium]